MTSLKKAAKSATNRGRETAVSVGRVAKSAAVEAAKAGGAAALAAGTAEFKHGMKEIRAAPARQKRARIASAVVAAAALTAVGVAMSRTRRG